MNIKVGMYVKTYDGIVAKCHTKNKNGDVFFDKYIVNTHIRSHWLSTDEIDEFIEKASFNLSDLFDKETKKEKINVNDTNEDWRELEDYEKNTNKLLSCICEDIPELVNNVKIADVTPEWIHKTLDTLDKELKEIGPNDGEYMDKMWNVLTTVRLYLMTIYKEKSKDSPFFIKVWKLNSQFKAMQQAMAEYSYGEHMEEMCNDCNETKFEFDNNFTFQKIKDTPIEELEYHISYDLASVYNEPKYVSAYLGVYDGMFSLTYSVHSKDDFYDEHENICEEIIDFENIKTQEQLEEIMKRNLDTFIETHRDIIKKVSEDFSNESEKLGEESI